MNMDKHGCLFKDKTRRGGAQNSSVSIRVYPWFAHLLLGIFILPALALAGNTDYGAFSDFRQGAGARAVGMGGAFTAVADDATAGFWNPAGLSQMELYNYEVGLQYVFLPNDVSSSYLSYSFQVPQAGSFGLSWMNLSAHGIEGRDQYEQPTGSFGSSENLFWVSYGRKAYGFLKGLSLGGNLKILQHSLRDSSAIGFGADIGAIWQPILYVDHTVGLAIKNIGQNLYWNTSGKTIDSSPLNANLGFAFRFLRSNDELYFTHLNASLDLEFASRGQLNIRAGGEYWFAADVGIRAGYTGQEITFGASYRPEYYEICYAYLFDLSVIAANQHRISINLRFP